MHIRLRSTKVLKSIHFQVLQARKPRFGYRIFFRPHVKGREDRVINLSRQVRRELRNERLANVTSTIKGSEMRIVRGTRSFHWSKGKLYSIRAVLCVPVYMVCQNKTVVVPSEFECLRLFYVYS